MMMMNEEEAEGGKWKIFSIMINYDMHTHMYIYIYIYDRDDRVYR